MLEDKEDELRGGALFTREFGRTASYYANRTFEPEWRKMPAEILPPNRWLSVSLTLLDKYRIIDGKSFIPFCRRSYDIQRASDLCGDVYQCQYDYAMSLNRDLAHFTLNYYSTYTAIRDLNLGDPGEIYEPICPIDNYAFHKLHYSFQWDHAAYWRPRVSDARATSSSRPARKSLSSVIKILY